VIVDRVDRDAFIATSVARPAQADDANALRFVGCGHPLRGYEVRIADGAGRELPERHVGRVEFQGPSATSGYFHNPAATAQLFDGDWLDTGDLGYVAEGELYLTGRAKDVMIRGGQNILPYELEEAVGNIPGIRKGCVAVFSVPDRIVGTERVVVLAETRATDEAQRAALVAQINRAAATLIAGPPDEVVLAPPHAVRKTSSGKIRRLATREAYEGGLLGARPRSVIWGELAVMALRAARGRLVQWRRGIATIGYACYVWTALAAMTAVAFACGFVLPKRLARGAMRAVARGAFRLAGIGVTVEGLERIPSQGPVVAAANHTSYADGLLFYALLPNRFTFAAKESFKRNPLTRIALAKAGAFFVERFDPARGIEDTRELTRITTGGGAVAVFPEGTFTRTPGLRPFRMGAFVIAASTGAPLVPIAFRGARSVLRANDWIVRRGVIRVVVAEPIMPDGTDWNAAVRLRDRARAEILRYCGEPDLAAVGSG
jgi:1-acyl-sn-glycerol-3-phosphate acyltransferase